QPSENQANEPSFSVADPTDQVDGPGTRASIADRLADERSRPRIIAKGDEIIAVGDVDGGDWPSAREIDEVAAIIDQCDDVDLRNVADAVAQHFVDVLSGQVAAELVRSRDALAGKAFLQPDEHKIDSLQRPCRVFGQHHAEPGELVL